MAKKGGNPQNLVSLTTEKARKIGAKGGKRSGEVKREKKLLSQIYSDLLSRKYAIDGENVTIEEIVQGVLSRQDAAAVSMLKEIREATEGSKIQHSGGISVNLAPLDETL